MTTVAFNYAVWAARYPELSASVDEPTATSYFQEACLYLDNSGCGVVQDPNRLSLILNMLTAHVAALYAVLNGQISPQTVGRISDASEGSVHVALEMGQGTDAAAWFQQTKYGASAWQALLPYRTMRYIPAPRPYLGVAYGYRGGRSGWIW